MTNLARRIGFCYSLAAFAASAACDSGAAPTVPSATDSDPAVPGRIVVLGDSLAVSPSKTVNFPAELQRQLEAAGRRWAITNASVSGDTTAGGVRRLEGAIDSGAQILVLALGANDGLRGVDIAAVEKNLSTIVERAQARGVRVLLCGMETPPMRGWNYTVEFHRVFPRIAHKYNVPLVPFLLTGVALVPEMNGEDDIHPNAAGARQIAANVWPYLEPLVERVSVEAEVLQER
jgi:acyl-CoA thioesterase-1